MEKFLTVVGLILLSIGVVGAFQAQDTSMAVGSLVVGLSGLFPLAGAWVLRKTDRKS